MAEPLVVFARITPKAACYDLAREAVLGIIPETRAEPGCHTFVLHEDADGTAGQADTLRSLYLYEVWADEAALAAHHAQPYTQAVFESYQTWLAAPVALTRLRQLDGVEGACSS